MTIDEEIELLKIDGECPTEAFEAAKRRIVIRATPEFIEALTGVAKDTKKNRWSRSAAIYVLGWVDHCARSEDALWQLARDPSQDRGVRSYAEEALYNFAQARRVHHSAQNCDTQYKDQGFDEWRAEQSGLPFLVPESIAA